MIETGKELNRQGYAGATNFKVLYPDAFKNERQAPDLGKLLSKTMDAIQKARKATTKPESIATIDGLLKSMEKAADINIKMREADQSEKLLQYIKDWVSWPCAPVRPQRVAWKLY